MPEQRAVDLLTRLNQLKAGRSNFDSYWQDVKDIIWPDGGDFTSDHSPGEKRTQKVFDMTAALVLEMGAAALETFLTPRTQRWHRLTPSNPELAKNAEVKEWMEAATDILFRVRNSTDSQFYSQNHEDWKSALAYGNGCMFVQELPRGGIRYRYTHVGKTWIDVSDENKVDTVYYEYKLTAKAAVQRWKDKAPKIARDAIGVAPHMEHVYVHCVYPNDDYDPDRLSPDAMRFQSAEISVADQSIIESGGYREFPYMWSRYTVNPAEMYGRGPGMLVLPEIQTLQDMERVFLRSGHKVADPPLLVANDGILGRGNKRVNARPGGLTVGGVDSQGRPLIVPLQTGARLDITMEMEDIKRQTIRSAFGLDLFDILLQDRPEMTATEVIERARQRGQLIAPMIGRMQEEKLGPMIGRELKILLRQNRLPRMPEVLIEAAGEYEIEYDSDATRMQKASESASIMRTIESMAPMIEAQPSLLEVFKGSDVLRHIAEINGVPAKLLHTPQALAQIQAANARQQALQQGLENAQAASGVVRDLASARPAA